MAEEPGGHGQLDAGRVLDLTRRLQDMRRRVDTAPVSPEQRRRWHVKLVAISESASDDLLRAETLLTRFERDLELRGRG